MLLQHDGTPGSIAEPLCRAFAGAQLSIVVDFSPVEHDACASVPGCRAMRTDSRRAKIDIDNLPLISWVECGSYRPNGLLQVLERTAVLPIVSISFAVLDTKLVTGHQENATIRFRVQQAILKVQLDVAELLFCDQRASAGTTSSDRSLRIFQSAGPSLSSHWRAFWLTQASRLRPSNSTTASGGAAFAGAGVLLGESATTWAVRQRFTAMILQTESTLRIFFSVNQLICNGPGV